MISGRSFKPQVTPEQLNRYTFNIIPDLDIVARFDDKADQFQKIRKGQSETGSAEQQQKVYIGEEVGEHVENTAFS